MAKCSLVRPNVIPADQNAEPIKVRPMVDYVPWRFAVCDVHVLRVDELINKEKLHIEVNQEAKMVANVGVLVQLNKIKPVLVESLHGRVAKCNQVADIKDLEAGEESEQSHEDGQPFGEQQANKGVDVKPIYGADNDEDTSLSCWESSKEDRADESTSCGEETEPDEPELIKEVLIDVEGPIDKEEPEDAKINCIAGREESSERKMELLVLQVCSMTGSGDSQIGAKLLNEVYNLLEEDLTLYGWEGGHDMFNVSDDIHSESDDAIPGVFLEMNSLPLDARSSESMPMAAYVDGWLDAHVWRYGKVLQVDGSDQSEMFDPGPRCNFTLSKALKIQRGPSEHPSASRLVMCLVLELDNKSYDLPASSNATHITVRLADECLKDPRCDFTYSKALKTQRGPSEHPSAIRMVSRLALKFVGKSYGLPTSSNASRMVIRLADGCSKGPRCNFTQSKALKMQRESFEHPSASRMVSRLALELAGKLYGLSTSSNAIHMTIRFIDECLEGPRCDFTYSKALKMQRGPAEHPSTSCMVMRFVLELADKPYDLPANSNASRITIRLADGCLNVRVAIISSLKH
ncbi:hypothetical protein L7F22_021798 [Adiantum nelumboides]|nr:hypothetical protein [Adiantum nelumboides]